MNNHLWCEACGDEVRAAYPCKFVFWDGRTIDLNICPDCLKHGKLIIDLPRKNLVSIVLTKLTAKRKWKKRGLK